MAYIWKKDKFVEEEKPEPIKEDEALRLAEENVILKKKLAELEAVNPPTGNVEKKADEKPTK